MAPRLARVAVAVRLTLDAGDVRSSARADRGMTG